MKEIAEAEKNESQNICVENALTSTDVSRAETLQNVISPFKVQDAISSPNSNNYKPSNFCSPSEMSAILLTVDSPFASQDRLMGQLFDALESSVDSIEEEVTLLLVEVRPLHCHPFNGVISIHQSNAPAFYFPPPLSP
jgi:hypothetical protein